VVFLRPDKPPRHLLDSLGVPRGAKILAAALLKDGTWLVATTLGLAVSREGLRDFYQWDKIDRAALRQQGALLALTFTGSLAPELFALQPKDKRFASVLNEQVAASVVDTEHVKAPGGQVIVALRRDPTDQHVYLQEIADPGIDEASAAPLVQAARQRLGEAADLPRSAW
jgi:hypothetical protein